METKTPTEAPLLNWTAQVSPTHVRGRIWYVIASTVVVFCIVFSVFTRAWTFTVITILTAFMYWKVHKQPEPNATISFWKTGFLFEKTFVPWTACAGFWFIQGPDYIELHVGRKSGRGKEIVIQTGSVDFMRIREVLSAFSEELPDKQEGLLDIIIRLCKI